ncbi:hypothetical protein [Saccharothrix sp. ALI-22-I]|uniref:hypothetical protein n=1 Tax=Saccharothrix sp. ALI-22-I TaxID=1933778 RepID=UPI00097C226F|nr:hypothetical protein [Saccharothrix sp. ALI-22-I]
MTHPGDGQSGWGAQPGQGNWGPQDPGYGRQQGYQQQGYGGSYGGLGVFSGGDEPPPKKDKTKLWLVIGAVLVVLIGGGVTAFVLTRPDSSTPVAQSTGSSTPTTTTAPSTTKSTTPSEPNSTCEPVKPGWNCLAVPALSYSYDVPKGWSPSPSSASVDALDVKLIGVSLTGTYDCGGNGFTRGGAGGVVVPQTDLTAVAKDFADKLATQYYNSAPKFEVKLSEPKPVTIPNGASNIQGVQVDATVTTSGDQCLATKGMVKVLVLKGDKGFHVFMANGDTEGGPADPKPLTEADLQGMVDSVKPLSRG